jgi:hypothetical protein
VGLSGQESKVLGARCVLELFDVGVVNAETELVEFLLDVFDDLRSQLRRLYWALHTYLLLENLSLLEDLFHCHRGDNDACFTLDDALDDVLNMAALTRSDSLGLVAGGF